MIDAAPGIAGGRVVFGVSALGARRWLVERAAEVGELSQAPGQPVIWFCFRDPPGDRLEVCSFPGPGMMGA